MPPASGAYKLAASIQPTALRSALSSTQHRHPSLIHALRPACLPRPLFARQCARHLSDKPSGRRQTDHDRTVGKQARGLEHLYRNGAAMSRGSASPFRPSILSPEDEKHIDFMFDLLHKTMPKTMSAEVEQVKQRIRREGFPKEVRDLINHAQNGPYTPALLAKLWRCVSKLTNEIPDADKNDGAKPQQKAGAHDTGPSSSKGSKQKTGSSREMPEIKLDLNTILIAAFTAYTLYKLFIPSEASREITWQEFRNTFLDKGLVEKLAVINQQQVRVYLHRENVADMYPESPAKNDFFYYYFSIGSVEAFERKLEQAQADLGIPSTETIPVQYVKTESWLPTLTTFAIVGSTFYLIYSMRRGMGGGGAGGSGIFGMGKSRAKKFNHETDVKVKFADVAGMDEAKQEIMEFVKFLKEPGMYQKLGAKIPRGAILSGPPGTGKTLLAKATAGESGVPFYSVSGSEFVEMFVGVGASRVRDLFANARKNTPCIIFIDEIDAIGRSRSKQSYGGGNDEREATLNQILTEMDGFNTADQVVVLAGTNRVDVLDAALLRPGRFDRHIDIDKPTMEGRKQIFAVHLKNVVTKVALGDIDGRLAALTPGFSGADIANCVNEAALIAARNGAQSVEMSHFESAIERVIGGLEKRSLILSSEEKRVVAYHEAGHAICGWYFKYADPLLKVSIIPRGQGALGYAQYLPAGDTFLMNVNQLMDRMAMTLAGRVSEELHFDTVTSGASDDFNKVTRMSKMMVTRFGMSEKIGHIYYDDEGQQQIQKPYSEAKAAEIDSEVKRIIGEAYKQCKDLLVAKKAEIGIVAEALLKKEMLTRDDLIELLGPRPFEEKGDFHKYFGSRGDREGPGGGFDPPPAEGGGKMFPGVASPGPSPAICDGSATP